MQEMTQKIADNSGQNFVKLRKGGRHLGLTISIDPLAAAPKMRLFYFLKPFLGKNLILLQIICLLQGTEVIFSNVL